MTSSSSTTSTTSATKSGGLRDGFHRFPSFYGLALPALAVPKSSLALRADRSTVDVLAPVRIPGLCAGAVGGLPPAGLAAATPFTNDSTAVATVVDTAAAVAVRASLADAEWRLLLVVVAPAPTGAGDDGVGVAILLSRNPLAASLTFVGDGGRNGGVERYDESPGEGCVNPALVRVCPERNKKLPWTREKRACGRRHKGQHFVVSCRQGKPNIACPSASSKGRRRARGGSWGVRDSSAYQHALRPRSSTSLRTKAATLYLGNISPVKKTVQASFNIKVWCSLDLPLMEATHRRENALRSYLNYRIP